MPDAPVPLPFPFPPPVYREVRSSAEQAARRRSYARKAQEWFISIVLERRASKDEILEAYLNMAPYGGNVEGAGAASEIYFQKRPKNLTVGEALLLAVLPQSPTLRSPVGAKQAYAPPGLEAARDLLLTRWLDSAGPFDVRVDGRPLTHLRSRRGQWLLAILALRRGREIERHWLADRRGDQKSKSAPWFCLAAVHPLFVMRPQLPR